MKITAAIVLTLMVLAGFCGESKKVNFKDLPPEKRVEIINKIEGGKISKPNSIKGKIVYVDAQKRAPKTLIMSQIAEFNKKLHYAIEIQDGEFTLPSPKLLAEANLFIVDDEKLPQSLLAPESRWVMVNVAPLAKGNGEKRQFFEARVKKALTRAVALLAGAQDSSYSNSLLCCMTSPDDFDTHIDSELPMDVVMRFSNYLSGYGIRPEKIVPYLRACQEGWAPAPTNDLQKHVWNRVHSIPDKPMKITFDPAAQKGKVTK